MRRLHTSMLVPAAAPRSGTAVYSGGPQALPPFHYPRHKLHAPHAQHACAGIEGKRSGTSCTPRAHARTPPSAAQCRKSPVGSCLVEGKPDGEAAFLNAFDSWLQAALYWFRGKASHDRPVINFHLSSTISSPTHQLIMAAAMGDAHPSHSIIMAGAKVCSTRGVARSTQGLTGAEHSDHGHKQACRHMCVRLICRQACTQGLPHTPFAPLHAASRQSRTGTGPVVKGAEKGMAQAGKRRTTQAQT